MSAPQSSNPENKIVLSISTRIEAMKAFVANISSNQTAKLLGRYRKLPSIDPDALDEVTLMTPENIHLNSFMYEPIVDMAGDHLRQLYSRVL